MKKRHSSEQIVAKLRQADVELGKGLKVPEVCRQLGISEQTYYRWRTKYGGMVLDEFTRECLAVEVARSFNAHDVRLVLQYLFAVRGVPEHIRSDNGPEFVAKDIRRWLDQAQVRTLYIEKASPWENGYVESFNGKLRDELLNGELFLSLAEARYVIDEWRLDYNHRRPHSSLNWQTPSAYAANLKHADGVFSSAQQADPPVGATPLPPAQPASTPPILS